MRGQTLLPPSVTALCSRAQGPTPLRRCERAGNRRRPMPCAGRVSLARETNVARLPNQHCRQAEACRRHLDCRGGRRLGPQIPGLLGDGQRRALFRRAGKHRQPDHGGSRALRHSRLGPAGRPPPPVRPSQGRVLLGRDRGRADRRRRAADLSRGLRCVPAAARAERAGAGAFHQRPRHRHQRRLVVFPADLGPPPALAGAGRRRLASHDRCRNLHRRDRRPAAGDG